MRVWSAAVAVSMQNPVPVDAALKSVCNRKGNEPHAWFYVDRHDASRPPLNDVQLFKLALDTIPALKTSTHVLLTHASSKPPDSEGVRALRLQIHRHICFDRIALRCARDVLYKAAKAYKPSEPYSVASLTSCCAHALRAPAAAGSEI